MRISLNDNLIMNRRTVNFRQAEITVPAAAVIPAETSLGSLAIGAAAIMGAVIAKNNIPKSYIKTLARDLSKELKKEVKCSDLKSVMTKSEFLNVTRSLKEENYIASKENIANGTFMADFHSHSYFSDGVSSVEDIMNQAAEYGDRLNRINGKKFLFALSDHDGIGGVKEALKLIALNPNKYKNVKFIPAAELSMPLLCENGSAKFTKTKNDVEMVELLIYGINPFSESSKEYFNTLYSRRKNGVVESLKQASDSIPGVKFLEDEYNKYFNRKIEPYCMLNQHWRIFQYINLKARITKLAKHQNRNPEELFQEIMSKIGNSTQVHGAVLDDYLKFLGMPFQKPTYLDEARALIKHICPYKNGETLHAPHDSSFENIVAYARNENALLGLAHPGFTLQNMLPENMLQNINKLKKQSRGRLIFAENYHQAYPSQSISTAEIQKTNEIMHDAKLIPIGGRDMHRDNFKFSV